MASASNALSFVNRLPGVVWKRRIYNVGTVAGLPIEIARCPTPSTSIAIRSTTWIRARSGLSRRAIIISDTQACLTYLLATVIANNQLAGRLLPHRGCNVNNQGAVMEVLQHRHFRE